MCLPTVSTSSPMSTSSMPSHLMVRGEQARLQRVNLSTSTQQGDDSHLLVTAPPSSAPSTPSWLGGWLESSTGPLLYLQMSSSPISRQVSWWERQVKTGDFSWNKLCVCVCEQLQRGSTEVCSMSSGLCSEKKVPPRSIKASTPSSSGPSLRTRYVSTPLWLHSLPSY